MAKHVYGWRPSPPDPNELTFQHHRLAGAVEIAAEVDPRDQLPIVYDQGQLGSCTANAVAAALQYDRYLDGAIKLRHDRPSRLDIYYGERALEGELGQGDTGAIGRDGFKFAQQTGYLLERQWPYDISKFQETPPTANPTTGAPYHRIKLTKQYASVSQSQAAIQLALNNQQTVAFGFTVYPSFESEKVAETGIVPLPTFNDQQQGSIGGHETLIVGYLEAYPTYALVRNSWGSGWGLGGYFLMPWAYITNSSLASDLRTIVR